MRVLVGKAGGASSIAGPKVGTEGRTKGWGDEKTLRPEARGSPEPGNSPGRKLRPAKARQGGAEGKGVVPRLGGCNLGLISLHPLQFKLPRAWAGVVCCLLTGKSGGTYPSQEEESGSISSSDRGLVPLARSWILLKGRHVGGSMDEETPVPSWNLLFCFGVGSIHAGLYPR